MKKIFKIIVLCLIATNVNNISLATSGSGPLKFTAYNFQEFLAYMRGDGNSKAEVGKKKGTPLAFAINKAGNYSYYYYCPMKFGDNCYPSHMKAMNECTKKSKARGNGRCFVFAKARKIVWDSKNIKLRTKFDEDEIRRIFQENNWLGSLSNQTIKSNKVDKKENKKITKKYELNGERSIALSWEGYKELIAGTVTFNEADYKGTLNLPLPNNDGSCDGSYSLQQGGKGTWQIACTNNMGAAGTLKWTENGGVTGSGRDHNGKKVKFTVSKKG